ncbi:hypothetical protein HK405_004192 [Cladochytrium tenue]|nr:hypothetical protein HK405_004192 [Cladochytrium tenue]
MEATAEGLKPFSSKGCKLTAASASTAGAPEVLVVDIQLGDSARPPDAGAPVVQVVKGAEKEGEGDEKEEGHRVAATADVAETPNREEEAAAVTEAIVDKADGADRENTCVRTTAVPNDAPRVGPGAMRMVAARAVLIARPTIVVVVEGGVLSS